MRELIRSVLAFKRADAEFRRAEAALFDADTDSEIVKASIRLNLAGTNYAVEKSKMFITAERVRKESDNAPNR